MNTSAPFAVSLHVVYEVKPGFNRYAIPGTYRLDHLRNLRDCQRVYIAARDRDCLGNSQFGEGEIRDHKGRTIARISHDGRLWSPEPRRWNTKPLAPSPDQITEGATA